MSLELISQSETKLHFKVNNNLAHGIPLPVPVVKELEFIQNANNNTYTIRFTAGSANEFDNFINHGNGEIKALKHTAIRETDHGFVTGAQFTINSPSVVQTFLQALHAQSLKRSHEYRTDDPLSPHYAQIEQFLGMQIPGRPVSQVIRIEKPVIHKISSNEDTEYMVLRYVPGPGSALYAGREQEWKEKGYTGCTGECEQDVNNIPAYMELGIATRLISTMTADEEITARGKRKFTTPNNTNAFSIVNDPEGNYEAMYSHKRVKITSGELVYPPHVVILRKVGFNQETGIWAGTPVDTIDRSNNPSGKTILDVVKADIAARQSNVNVDHQSKKVKI